MKATVHVTLKPGVLDPAGQAVKGGLHALGFPEVQNVRIGKYFEVSLDDHPEAEARLKDMCDKLLANTVIENYRIELRP